MQGSGGRRLTGPSWWLDGPGVAVDVVFAPHDNPQLLFGQWRRAMRRNLASLQPFALNFATMGDHHSATWACTLPVDCLDAGVELAETLCSPRTDLKAVRAKLPASRSPAVRAWIAHAEAHGLPWLLDDEGLTIGLGEGGRTWPLAEVGAVLPEVGGLATIPHVLITGTNGKTTTARLLARILQENGWSAGNTSTDGLMLNGVLVEPGDWTGPGGARKVLRNPEVQAAALETARGGLLRRGLVSRWADAALVTNVSDDHLEERGVRTVAQMAEAKLSIRKGIRPGGWLIVNAACAPLVAAVKRLGLARGPWKLAWFSGDRRDLAHLRGFKAWVEAGKLVAKEAGPRTVVARLDQIPLTFGGTAPHNVANALAATLAARSLGIAVPVIARGLGAFGSSVADNPGRANVFALHGATLLVDFAHNPDGVRQLASLIDKWPSTHRTLLVGQAGDRTDALMLELVRASLALRPDRVVLKDTDHYLRGRQKGEIPDLLTRYYVAEGIPASAISVHPDELDALRESLRDAQPGHLLILLIHDDFAGAIAQLRASGAIEQTSGAAP